MCVSHVPGAASDSVSDGIKVMYIGLLIFWYIILNKFLLINWGGEFKNILPNSPYKNILPNSLFTKIDF